MRINSIIKSAILILFILSCNERVRDEKQPCIDRAVTNAKDKIIDYKLDTVFIQKGNFHAQVSVKGDRMERYLIYPEREYAFYILSHIRMCTDWDSVKVQFMHDTIPGNELLFSFSHAEFLSNLGVRDSAFNSAISNLVHRKHYRDIISMYSHEVGVAINNDPDGMYTLDFFQFLLDYLNEVKIGNQSEAYVILLRMEREIQNSGILIELKSEMLDFIKYLKELRVKQSKKKLFSLSKNLHKPGGHIKFF